MRKNQVTITLERFGDTVPKNLNAKSMKIEVYADSNDVYEALSAAFNGVLEEIKKNQAMPEFGVVSSHSSTRLSDDLEEI